MQNNSECCNNNCNQGRNCPLRAATPAEVECEAETVERILNKGEQLENRAYWLSRPANINQPNPPADANHGYAYCAAPTAKEEK